MVKLVKEQSLKFEYECPKCGYKATGEVNEKANVLQCGICSVALGYVVIQFLGFKENGVDLDEKN